MLVEKLTTSGTHIKNIYLETFQVCVRGNSGAYVKGFFV